MDSWNLASEYHDVLLEIKEEAQRLAPVELMDITVSSYVCWEISSKKATQMTFSRFWESDSLCVCFKVFQQTVSSNPGCVFPRFLVIFVVNACNSSPMRQALSNFVGSLVIPSVAPDRWKIRYLPFKGKASLQGATMLC